ncbi:MAG: cation:proton antiporter [Candidatus Limnocylindrales bacterium]
MFILFVGAKIGEEVARRLGQPSVVGELLGGFLVGPGFLAFVVPGETAFVLAEIGVVILLFSVGLEVRLDDLLAVGRPAVLTAIAAMILPIAAGLAIGLATGEPLSSAAFIALALSATSIGITSRVLAEMGVLDRTFARVVLGAAVIDDILALILIGIVSGAATGDLSGSTILVVVAAFGLIGIGFAAARRARGLKREVFTWPLFAETPLVPAFILMFAVALVSAAIGLAAIIGAFVAGLIVAETEAQDELEHEMRPLGQIFTPFFFAVTGAQIDLRALLDPQVAALAIGLAIVGIITKAAGGLLGARSIGRWGPRRSGSAWSRVARSGSSSPISAWRRVS